MAGSSASRWPVGPLAIVLSILALSVVALLVGKPLLALAMLLGASAAWALPWLLHRSPVEEEQAGKDVARKASEQVRVAYKRGGMEAVRELSGVVVHRNADGSVAAAYRPPPLKAKLGIPAVTALVAVAFLAYKWHELPEMRWPFVIIEGCILAAGLTVTVCLLRRETYSASAEGFAVVTKWPILPAFRRSVLWTEVLDLRAKDAAGEPLFPDVMMVPAKGKPLFLDTVLLEAVCEEAACEASLAVMKRVSDLTCASLAKEAAGKKPVK